MITTVLLIGPASTARMQLNKVGPKAYLGAFWQLLYGPCMTLEHSQQPAWISCVLVFAKGGKSKYSTAQRKVTTLSRDANRVTRYAILVARDATFVVREALKTVSIVA